METLLCCVEQVSRHAKSAAINATMPIKTGIGGWMNMENFITGSAFPSVLIHLSIALSPGPYLKIPPEIKPHANIYTAVSNEYADIQPTNTSTAPQCSKFLGRKTTSSSSTDGWNTSLWRPMPSSSRV